MKKTMILLSLFGITAALFGQYEILKDPRTGKNVRYAGDLAAKPTVAVPKRFQVPAKSFRGVWVATVENIDFPVSGSAEAFKRNFRTLVNNLKIIGANAVLFQVRPMNDAFYPSRLNPWSRHFSGREGVGFGNFDPLAFMVEEAHRKGLEFHAWLNPYRVANPTNLTKSQYLRTLAKNNFARKNPSLVLTVPCADGKNRYILDPGNPETIAFLRDTVAEIIRRYPVDAIHLDDYFYPYEKLTNQDIPTYQRYNRQNINIDDWRRNNVDKLIFQLHTLIRDHNRKNKTGIQFGISPFGIWANRSSRFPEGSPTKGTESYSVQHADTRKWIRNNWIDYIVPQLYWTFGHNTAAYAGLADWWVGTVRGSRTKLYIGHAVSRLGTSAEWSNPNEIYNQMRFNSMRSGISGSVMFSYSKLLTPSDPKMKRGAEEIIRAWRNAK